MAFIYAGKQDRRPSVLSQPARIWQCFLSKRRPVERDHDLLEHVCASPNLLFCILRDNNQSRFTNTGQPRLTRGAL